MQSGLFDQQQREPERLAIPDAEILRYPQWLEEEAAGKLMTRLLQDAPWEQPTITIAGKQHKIPRKQVWYGDAGAVMRYSGQTFTPVHWHPWLARLRTLLEQTLERPFNSALVNYYRDGNDSVSWHADDEPELGRRPCIASISLGVTRRFSFKHRSRARTRYDIDLQHGDLLVMAGDTQHHWLHAINKTRQTVGPRINLTYRQIML